MLVLCEYEYGNLITSQATVMVETAGLETLEEDFKKKMHELWNWYEEKVLIQRQSTTLDGPKFDSINPYSYKDKIKLTQFIPDSVPIEMVFNPRIGEKAIVPVERARLN